MLKDKGYDEFLAERIKLGLDEMSKGEGLTLEQSKTRAKQVMEQKVQELAEYEREIAYT